MFSLITGITHPCLTLLFHEITHVHPTGLHFSFSGHNPALWLLPGLVTEEPRRGRKMGVEGPVFLPAGPPQPATVPSWRPQLLLRKPSLQDSVLAGLQRLPPSSPWVKSLGTGGNSPTVLALAQLSPMKVFLPPHNIMEVSLSPETREKWCHQ